MNIWCKWGALKLARHEFDGKPAMPSPRSFLNLPRTLYVLQGQAFPPGLPLAPLYWWLQIHTLHLWFSPELQTSLVNQLPSRWHHCTCPQSFQKNSMKQMGLIFPIQTFFYLYSYFGMNLHWPRNGKLKPKHHQFSPLPSSCLQLVTTSLCDFLLSIPQIHSLSHNLPFSYLECNCNAV